MGWLRRVYSFRRRWRSRSRRFAEPSRGQGGSGGDDHHENVEITENPLSSPASIEMVESGGFPIYAPEGTIPSSHASIFMGSSRYSHEIIIDNDVQSTESAPESAPDETIPNYHASFFMVMLASIFRIRNLLLELLSEVFNQISSRWHPRQRLIGGSRGMAEKRWFLIGAVVIWRIRCRRATNLSRAMRGSGRDDQHQTTDNVEIAESLHPSPAPIEMGSIPINALDRTIPSSPASFYMVRLDWIFLIANFLLELLSEVFNQIHPRLGLVGMLMALAALLVCVIELIYRGHKEEVRWRKRNNIHWCFQPNGLPFGTLLDAVALVCSMSQCVLSTIAYASKHSIKFSPWPIILALALLCSKSFNERNWLVQPDTGEEDEDVAV